jgi:transposase
LYLDEFAKQHPDEFKILILDNGAFHKAAQLQIPPNIALLFIPPYSPELNPAEKMWRHLKDQIANEVFKTIDDLSDRLFTTVRNLSHTTIKSITGCQYYLDNYYALF